MSGLLDLTTLLSPRSIAVIGATPDARRVGGRPVSYLQRFGYGGRVYPVNPRYDTIGELRCFPTIRAVPDPVDMAIVSLPASAVLDAVRECQASGISAITIYSSGFAEMGERGHAHEAELRRMAAEHGTLILGPNCQGPANFFEGMVANFSSGLVDLEMPGGPIGFATQSGLFGGIAVTECVRRGLGLGYMVSTGNEVGVQITDVLGHMLRDPRIRVVAAYVEGIRDGERLRQLAELSSEHNTPVVLLKVGRSEAAARAAASHTGSLAGSYRVYQAAFRQWGLVEVDDIEGLFDALAVFSADLPPCDGGRVAAITNSGGVGVYCVDKVQEHGLKMAQLSAETRAAIVARLPEFGSPDNPVDTTLQAFTDPEAIGSHLRHLLADDGVDVLMVVLGVQQLNVPELVAEIRGARDSADKPVIVVWMAGHPEGERLLAEAGIPVFPEPLRAIHAIEALAEHGRRQRRPARASSVPPEGDFAGAAELVERARRAGARALGEHASKLVLAACGIRITRERLATSADEAAAVADELGYPVALKVESADIAHKTEAGGVALDLGGAAEVRAAFDRMLRTVQSRQPSARIDGVLVQEMVTGAVEMLVGVTRDPVFGPTVLLGMGGVLAEVLRDTTLRIAPLDREGAEEMVRELGGAPLLSGARGRPPADVPALVDTLLRVSRLALDAEGLQELDVNPLMVLAAGRGVVAADALIVPRPSAGPSTAETE